MKVIADTNIWSYALRRKSNDFPLTTTVLNNLITSNSIVIIGPIRQELLTGFRVNGQFEKLKSHLRQFSDYPIQTDDYEIAAEFHTTCSSNGIQGSPVDFLICAVSYVNDFEIYTLDKDFSHYQKHIPIKLHITPYRRED